MWVLLALHLICDLIRASVYLLDLAVSKWIILIYSVLILLIFLLIIIIIILFFVFAFLNFIWIININLILDNPNFEQIFINMPSIVFILMIWLVRGIFLLNNLLFVAFINFNKQVNEFLLHVGHLFRILNTLWQLN